jgi:hypothetical protein
VPPNPGAPEQPTYREVEVLFRILLRKACALSVVRRRSIAMIFKYFSSQCCVVGRDAGFAIYAYGRNVRRDIRANRFPMHDIGAGID